LILTFFERLRKIKSVHRIVTDHHQKTVAPFFFQSIAEAIDISVVEHTRHDIRLTLIRDQIIVAFQRCAACIVCEPLSVIHHIQFKHCDAGLVEWNGSHVVEVGEIGRVFGDEFASSKRVNERSKGFQRFPVWLECGAVNVVIAGAENEMAGMQFIPQGLNKGGCCRPRSIFVMMCLGAMYEIARDSANVDLGV
jgi:hypothetical protein